MARAGFYCSEIKPNADCARCYVCQHEILWDAEDDPRFLILFFVKNQKNKNLRE